MISGENMNPSMSARQKMDRLIQLVPQSKNDSILLLNEFEKEKFAGKEPNINLARRTIKKMWANVFCKIITNLYVKVISFFSRRSK
jgi:hypothetical protein